eukprot:4249424-Pleurochrysis_carterae.AAC.3
MASPPTLSPPPSIVAAPPGRLFRKFTQSSSKLLNGLLIILLPTIVHTLSLPQDSKPSRVALKQCSNAAKGTGAFAAGPKSAVVFKQGELVGNYEGELLTEAQIQQRYSGPCAHTGIQPGCWRLYGQIHERRT